MNKYFDVLVNFGIFLFFSLSNIIVYYATGHHHSRIPFMLSLIPTAIVGVLCVMALLEIHKHRNDKEPW